MKRIWLVRRRDGVRKFPPRQWWGVYHSSHKLPEAA